MIDVQPEQAFETDGAERITGVGFMAENRRSFFDGNNARIRALRNNPAG